MKKPSKKTINITLLIAVLVIVIVLVVNYKTNYNWRYRKLIKELIDVPNKEAIIETDFRWGPTPSTFLDIAISGGGLSDEEIYQMGYDIADKIDQYIYLEIEQPLTINVMDIRMNVYCPKDGRGISCDRRMRFNIPGNGDLDYYEWLYEIYPYSDKNKVERRITYPYPKGE